MAPDTSECNEAKKSNGPSSSSLNIGGWATIISMIGSGILAYTTLQTDIATLKKGEMYQERVNDQLREDLKVIRIEQKEIRNEQKETMKELNAKLDHLIDRWSQRKFE